MSQSPLPDSNRRPLPYHASPPYAWTLENPWKGPESWGALDGVDLLEICGVSTRHVPGDEEAAVRAMAGRRALSPQGYLYGTRVLMRDPCAYCGGEADTIDHIEALVKWPRVYTDVKSPRGSYGPENLTAACRSCNSRKSNRPLLRFLAARVGVREAMSIREQKEAA